MEKYNADIHNMVIVYVIYNAQKRGDTDLLRMQESNIFFAYNLLI